MPTIIIAILLLLFIFIKMQIKRCTTELFPLCNGFMYVYSLHSCLFYVCVEWSSYKLLFHFATLFFTITHLLVALILFKLSKQLQLNTQCKDVYAFSIKMCKNNQIFCYLFCWMCWLILSQLFSPMFKPSGIHTFTQGIIAFCVVACHHLDRKVGQFCETKPEGITTSVNVSASHHITFPLTNWR